MTATTHLGPGQGESLLMPDGAHVVKATVRDSEGAFEVFEVIAPAAPPAPPHTSPWTGVLYLLEGRIRFLAGATWYDVEPGGVVVLPAGTAGTFEVVGGPARFLAVTSGVGAGAFFADFARSVPLDRPMEEALPAMLAVTQRHGVGVAAP